MWYKISSSDDWACHKLREKADKKGVIKKVFYGANLFPIDVNYIANALKGKKDTPTGSTILSANDPAPINVLAILAKTLKTS